MRHSAEQEQRADRNPPPFIELRKTEMLRLERAGDGHPDELQDTTSASDFIIRRSAYFTNEKGFPEEISGAGQRADATSSIPNRRAATNAAMPKTE